tara:strand:- start:177 stop:395 length:219 start_codon:yes stop_codon:yes gene_type:complete
MKIKQLLYRRIDDLTQEEEEFFENGQDVLNTCDKYDTIHYSTDLYWDDEHDLKGDYAALCEEAYKEVGGNPL